MVILGKACDLVDQHQEQLSEEAKRSPAADTGPTSREDTGEAAGGAAAAAADVVAVVQGAAADGQIPSSSPPARPGDGPETESSPAAAAAAAAVEAVVVDQSQDKEDLDKTIENVGSPGKNIQRCVHETYVLVRHICVRLAAILACSFNFHECGQGTCNVYSAT